MSRPLYCLLFLLVSSCGSSRELPKENPPKKIIPPPETQPAASASQPKRSPWEQAFQEGKDLFSLWGKSKDDLYAVGDAGTILHTNDTGLTWEKQKSETQKSLYSIWGTGDVIFIAGADGTLLRSRDRGTTWTQINGIPKRDLLAVWGSSAEDIYVVGDKGSIFHATDGATFVQAPTTHKENLLAVWGSSANEVYVAGENGFVARSTDQGKTWTKEESNTNATFRSIWGKSPEEVYLWGTDSPPHPAPKMATLFYKHQGAWQLTQTKGEGYAITGDEAGLYAVGPYASLRSQDQGKTWAPWILENQHKILKDLNAIWIAPTKEIFIAGQRGLLLRSESQGERWSLLAGPLSVDLYDTLVSSDGSALAFGAQGMILRWKPGAPVEILQSPTDATLQSAQRIGETLYVLGVPKVLLMSQDQGAHWSILQGPATQLPESLFSPDAKTLYWIASDSIIASLEGQERWKVIHRDAKKSLYALAGNPEELYAVGAKGAISYYETGSGWKTLSSAVKEDLRAAWSPKKGELIAVGTQGTIVQSQDRGKTWKTIDAKTTNNLSDIWGTTTLYLTGEEGVLLRSEDGGQSWQKEELPSQRDLWGVRADGGYLYLVGDGFFARRPL